MIPYLIAIVIQDGKSTTAQHGLSEVVALSGNLVLLSEKVSTFIARLCHGGYSKAKTESHNVVAGEDVHGLHDLIDGALSESTGTKSVLEIVQEGDDLIVVQNWNTVVFNLRGKITRLCEVVLKYYD